MDVVVVVVVTVLLVTTVLLVVLLIGLFRQLQVLARSLGDLNETIAPRLAEIQRRSDEAKRRADAVAQLQAELQEGPKSRPGARLRG